MKGCPRCGGQMSLERDPEYGNWEWHCLQCGHVMPRRLFEGLKYIGNIDNTHRPLNRRGFFNRSYGIKLPGEERRRL